ncbi:YheC/D like ATP-grasp [Paenisporosarcina quisquiliarum]|nr:YheC/D like ATP-grasp [Paenisporosarcina quisquiliarum]
MGVSRGRLSQYKLLQKEKRLQKHLVQTVLFSRQELFSLLDQYNTVVVKPSYGPGNIMISFVNNKYQIKSTNKMITITNKEDMFEYINQYEIKQKYYIIQPLQPARTPYQFFVTVHRKNSTSNWCVTSITKCSDSKILMKNTQQYFFEKYKGLSYIVANKLGKSFPTCNTIVVEVITDDKKNIGICEAILHFSISKWDQYQSLRGPLIPKTDLLTSSTFRGYVKRYNEVIIKPCNGQHGLGVVQIKRTQHQSYEIHSGISTITKPNIDETYKYAMDTIYTSNKDYIIQEKVQLATIDECSLDVRVITQKYESGWNVTGKIVKLAGKGFIVTNAAQKLLTLEDAIQDSTILSKNSEAFHKKIDEVCLSAANQLDKKNIGLKIIGFDVGITDEGDIWIIEGNYVPDLTMFKEHKDQNVYMNILKINNRKK